MSKQRLEAFSDGVVAILITIMVLELHAPAGADFAALRSLLPNLFGYVLSFIYLGIYWNNHHHMFQAAKHVSGGVLWANLHLLFWLSLFPFATSWFGRHYTETLPAALYGGVLLLAAVAYTILQTAIIAVDGHGSVLARAVAHDRKGKLSLVLYVIGIASAFYHPALAEFFYVTVAVIWLVPDRRIESVLEGGPAREKL